MFVLVHDCVWRRRLPLSQGVARRGQASILQRHAIDDMSYQAANSDDVDDDCSDDVPMIVDPLGDNSASTA